VRLIRLKLTDTNGFRSLQKDFEYYFRKPLHLQSDNNQFEEFAPFVCAGPNGSGKSNLLELLAAIFYHLECMYLESLPDSFAYDPETNPEGYRSDLGLPDAFELEYLIKPKQAMKVKGHKELAHVLVKKIPKQSPKWFLLNHEEQEGEVEINISGLPAKALLPDFVLGYSSGENEILSLPFFKMRFIQYDEYWQCLQEQLPYSGRPETRLAYIDNSFSQAILLCNLLFPHDDEVMKPFKVDIGINELLEFRIVIKRTISVSPEQAQYFSMTHPALRIDDDTDIHTINLVQLLEENTGNDSKFAPLITRLKRCATCYFIDKNTDTLHLDYCVDNATKQAFAENFSFDANGSPIELFQVFQVLLSLNLYSVNDSLKTDLYQSNSHYVSETVPSLASDERIMRFKFVKFTKQGVNQSVMLKDLSDGEHQLLHSLGLCLLFKDTNSLFLLDEPETHFNPQWRANFITRLRQSLNGNNQPEMLITTHTPFLISDSKPEKVLVFNKENGAVSISNPEYNTLGASINKITMATFDKRETIGGLAQAILDDFTKRSLDKGENKQDLINEINDKLGDSVEKVLLVKAILDDMEGRN
jgi:restriction system-associated AAA family ATPase